MSFLYIKSLHIIFVVTWFAGLFYIVRLFIYYAEAAEKPAPEKIILQKQFNTMQRRLWYGITWPSAIITLFLGILLVSQYPLVPAWLWVKLFLVAGLFVYHMLCHLIFIQQQKGIAKHTSTRLRIWNEVATLFLVGIVFLVVLKNVLNMFWGVIGFLLLSMLLFLCIHIYKAVRARHKS